MGHDVLGIGADMGGHILWLDVNEIVMLEKLYEKLRINGLVSLREIKVLFEPILWQAALHEQHGVMRKLENAGLPRAEIAKLLGYDYYTVDEILSLDWDEEYDYSQFSEVRSFSIHPVS